MKIIKKLCVIVIIISILIISIICLLFFRSSEVNEFSVNDFRYEIDTFSTNVEHSFQNAETVEDAKKIAKDVIDKVYRTQGHFFGTNKPYTVSFDEDNQIWLVQASALFLPKGGAHILINKSDGKVIAVWNYKF